MFCVRGFGGGLGFLSFLGGCSGLSVVFSRASGVFCVSRSFCSCLLGVGAGCGGFRGSGFGAPGRLASFLLGGGSGVRLRAPGCSPGCLVLAVVGSGGRGRVCACCPVPVVGVGLRPVSSAACCGGGFRVLFFPSGASRVLLVSGVGLRGLAGGWGVVGGVGLGSGLFFLRLLLYWPGLVSGFLRGGWFGFGLGFVWRV